jgi:tetratricopeptide (TPR) repeat protein
MSSPAAKSQPRLMSRRLIVVDAEPARARALAQALQASGASVVPVSPADADHRNAHGLDAEVMLVNSDEADTCQPVVAALRAHPRTRWATVVPLSFVELWPEPGEQPDLVAVANAVGTLAVTAVELAVRTKGRLPYETVLEPLGPSRTLRAVGNTGRKLRVVLSDGRTRAELELEDGMVGGARAKLAGSTRTLSNAHALAEVLAMTFAQVRVEERTTATLRDWNVSLTAALASAAALGTPRWARSGTRPVIAAADTDDVDSGLSLLADDGPRGGATPRGMQPTVPQISRAEVLASAAEPTQWVREHEPEAQPAFEVEYTHEHDHEYEVAPAPRRSQRPTARDIALAEALAVPEEERSASHADADAAEPQIETSPELDAALESSDTEYAFVPSRPRARVVWVAARIAGGTVAVALAALLTGVALFARSGHVLDGSVQRAFASTHLAPALEPIHDAPATVARPRVAGASPPATARGALAVPTPEPAVELSAQRGAANNAVPLAPTQPPTRASIERAKVLVKAASRHQRAKRYAEATAGYLRALELAPQDLTALTGLVRVQLQEKNGADALRWAERLIALQPDGRTSLLLLGDTHALTGNVAEAERAWRRASQLGSTTAQKRLQQR